MKVRPGPELAGRAYMKRSGMRARPVEQRLGGARRVGDPVRQVFQQRAGRVVVHHHAVALALRPVQRQRRRLVDRRRGRAGGRRARAAASPTARPRARRPARRCRSAPDRYRSAPPPVARCSLAASSGAGALLKVSRASASGCAARKDSKAGCIRASAPPTSRMVIETGSARAVRARAPAPIAAKVARRVSAMPCASCAPTVMSASLVCQHRAGSRSTRTLPCGARPSRAAGLAEANATASASPAIPHSSRLRTAGRAAAPTRPARRPGCGPCRRQPRRSPCRRTRSAPAARRPPTPRR